jgi:endonuclease I
MYSNCTFTFGTDQDQGSGGTKECEYYNREHSIPNSWFGGQQYPMYADLFHLYPVDKYVNAERANYPYGETNNPTQTYGNGSKRGKGNPETGYTGVIFEPIDEYKGDFARTCFYMATRYIDKDFTQSDEGKIIFTYNSSRCDLTTYSVNLFVDWHRQDPISDKEINRNNAVYNVQKNRNPFIDYPELVELIWGADIGDPFLPDVKIDEGLSETSVSVWIYPNPTSGEWRVESGEWRIENVEIFDVLGKSYGLTVLPSYGLDSVVPSYGIDISHLPANIYFLQIQTENSAGSPTLVTKKVVKN